MIGLPQWMRRLEEIQAIPSPGNGRIGDPRELAVAYASAVNVFHATPGTQPLRQWVAEPQSALDARSGQSPGGAQWGLSAAVRQSIDETVAAMSVEDLRDSFADIAPLAREIAGLEFWSDAAGIDESQLAHLKLVVAHVNGRVRNRLATVPAPAAITSSQDDYIFSAKRRLDINPAPKCCPLIPGH